MGQARWFFVLFMIPFSLLVGCGAGSVNTSSTKTGTSTPGTPGTTNTASGFASLAWNAPTTNTDGTSLMDLAGYKVYYGPSSGNYTKSIDVGNITSYTLNNLSTGTYYIAVTAYDTAGIESGYSNEVNKVIN